MLRLRTLRLALAGSLGASVALGVHAGLHGRDGIAIRPLSLAGSVAYSLSRPLTVSASMLAPSPAETAGSPSVGCEEGARIIDGKAIAATVRAEIKTAADELKQTHGVTPGLAVVLVGNRTDSATYVRMKKKAAAEVGFYSVDKTFEESVTQVRPSRRADACGARGSQSHFHACADEIIVQLPRSPRIHERLNRSGEKPSER